MKTEEKKSTGGGPERTIGLMAAINIIVGVIIGSGVFLTPGAVLRYSGSPGFALIIWAASGLISLMGKFEYILHIMLSEVVPHLNPPSFIVKKFAYI